MDTAGTHTPQWIIINRLHRILLILSCSSDPHNLRNPSSTLALSLTIPLPLPFALTLAFTFTLAHRLRLRLHPLAQDIYLPPNDKPVQPPMADHLTRRRTLLGMQSQHGRQKLCERIGFRTWEQVFIVQHTFERPVSQFGYVS